MGQVAQPARRLFTAAEARLAIGPQVIAHAINLTPQRARTSLNKARLNNRMSDARVVVGVFHHPYPWLNADVGVEFRRHIEKNCDIVLTGHQHFDHAFGKITSTGEALLYSEAEAFFEGNSLERSGFRAVLLRTEEQSRRILTYRWENARYKQLADSGWNRYSQTGHPGQDLMPTAAFLDRLADSGIGLMHRKVGAVPLRSVFVYPDASVTRFAAVENRRELSGAQLLQYLMETPKALIQGPRLSGRTSLAKMIIADWLRDHSSYPILLRGRDIKRADQSGAESLFCREIAHAYGPDSVERYQQLSPESKILVIDDWDQSPLSTEDRDRFLKVVECYFGKIVLFVEGVSYIQALLTKLKGTEAILSFDHFVINELSHVARGIVIDRWVGLEIDADRPEYSRRVEESERLVNTIIGKNTLPSLPFIVLSILQAAQVENDAVLENGSFGYLYEVLITGALNLTKGDRAQLDRKYTFLSILAYRLFEQKLEMLPRSAVHELLDSYADDFMVRLDKQSLLEDLESARVLVNDGGNFSFAYPHYFHYFVARYFKNNVHGSERNKLRAYLRSISAGLNIASNRTFLMFYIYLSHDDDLMRELVDICERVMSDVPASDLASDVAFYNSDVAPERKSEISEAVDLDSSRLQRRKAADVARNSRAIARSDDMMICIDCEPYSHDMPAGAKLAYAWSCIEILGQVLRNFAGSLPGPQKLDILQGTYVLGLRTLRVFLTSLGGATARVKEETASRDMKVAKEREFVKKLERFLLSIGPLVTSAMLRSLSLSVGSSELDSGAYRKTLERVGRNNATELLDLAIKLDHSEVYPFNEVKSLHVGFRDNRFAVNVLRHLVVLNMHVFDIGREMRQRVLGVLNVRTAGDAVLSRVNKRFKPRSKHGPQDK